jgi:hypothetical protein
VSPVRICSEHPLELWTVAVAGELFGSRYWMIQSNWQHKDTESALP